MLKSIHIVEQRVVIGIYRRVESKSGLYLWLTLRSFMGFWLLFLLFNLFFESV